MDSMGKTDLESMIKTHKPFLRTSCNLFNYLFEVSISLAERICNTLTIQSERENLIFIQLYLFVPFAMYLKVVSPFLGEVNSIFDPLL